MVFTGLVWAKLAISASGSTGVPVSESAPMRIPQAPFPESCNSAKARSAPANARTAVERFANPALCRFSESSRKFIRVGFHCDDLDHLKRSREEQRAQPDIRPKIDQGDRSQMIGQGGDT